MAFYKQQLVPPPDGVPVTAKCLGVRKHVVHNVWLNKLVEKKELEVNRFRGVVINDVTPNLSSGLVRMAIDGSVQHNKGGAGVFLTDDLGWLTKKLVPVDGNGRDITSSQAELHTIYAGYKHLDEITGVGSQPQLHSNIWSNSDSLLKKLLACP